MTRCSRHFVATLFIRGEFIERNALTAELVAEIDDAWRAYLRSQLAKALTDEDLPEEGNETRSWIDILAKSRNVEWKLERSKKDEKFDMHLKALAKTETALKEAKALLAKGDAANSHALRLIDESQDVLAKVLDKKYGNELTDPALSRSLAQYWEGQFFKDMARLRVRAPDTLTRVTEYVPEIVAFVERIVANGFAYESAGSVYFDTGAFERADGHTYPKLQPGSKGNTVLLEEGEGVLAPKAVGQRSKSDFALWKGSKPGEPSWPSSWGAGRPGWHIECSVMASAVFGENMDIHSGGIDLAFPHHDNEMAQSEAYHNCGQWVNYFLHTGHLHIEGLKMSKSLKNFITVDEILQKYSPRQLRLAFLTQLWNSKVDFTDSLMSGEVRVVETTLTNFFAVTKAVILAHADGSSRDGQHQYGPPERELQNFFHETQTSFRAALCDSFNTPLALEILLKLVSRTNIYINTQGHIPDAEVVECIARWIGKMLRMFGLGEGDAASSEAELGWGEERASGSINRDEVLMPYLLALSSFRDSIRRRAIAGGDGALKDILALSDHLRDEDLVSLGVALDDQEDGKAFVKLVDPVQLRRTREEKLALSAAKAAKKAAAVDAEQHRRLARIEKGRTPPTQMFKPLNVPVGIYGSWDESGVPLTDGEGKPLSKNALKKVQKEYAAQVKAHQDFLQWQKN
ncbi:tRNA synthetases class I (C) catalytic domain-containing protein [Phellopilus nigrolimitatus]|nr:tRNA synthetases class I (C) catalytic domain-containing protein [Phellopilus nigrolimitatus]